MLPPASGTVIKKFASVVDFLRARYEDIVGGTVFESPGQSPGRWMISNRSNENHEATQPRSHAEHKILEADWVAD